MISKELLKKYDVPAPRYTSYPTVPYWKDLPTTEEWIASLQRSAPTASWSIYMHIPFCESLCTYCGCNTSITRNHEKGAPYVDHLIKELKIYRTHVPELFSRPLRQIHLGGGTPTFLSSSELYSLINRLKELTSSDPTNFEGSIEVDPRRTTNEQLQLLRECGFNRVSMGIQDFNPEVQRLVNRIQPFELTRNLLYTARSLGYKSINFDLIYGLPKQTPNLMERTITRTILLRPDRIALYSFAKVPWIKPQQRLFKEEDLPEGADKRNLYEQAYRMLIDFGYIEIGMDHFALPTDALARAQKNKTLHRNFMGYTDIKTDILLGLGVSAISETPHCFHQNEKVLPIYERKVDEKKIPSLRGHKLSMTDRVRRNQILEFMTCGEVELEDQLQADDVRNFLAPLLDDKLISLDGLTLKIMKEGRPFLRNACMALDQRLREEQPHTRIFSQAL